MCLNVSVFPIFKIYFSLVLGLLWVTEVYLCMRQIFTESVRSIQRKFIVTDGQTDIDTSDPMRVPFFVREYHRNIKIRGVRNLNMF